MKTPVRNCGCSKTADAVPIVGREESRNCLRSPADEIEPARIINRKFIVGTIQTPSGAIPQVATRLNISDYVGTARVRWSIGRDRYRVEPGLYAVGTPDRRSDVIVTANYKLTFDTVRKNLAGLNAWLLVLDTKGINVWCAAGKGTFGTEELVRRIRLTSLEKLVIHRRLILPQLGATGVAAHRVKKASGFTVLYGPIRASDIRSFIDAGYRASNEMRLVSFTWYDRLILTPNDFIHGSRYLLAAVFVWTILSGVTRTGISFQQSVNQAAVSAVNIVVGYFAGIVLTPLLLPFIPVRMFALKGFVVGLLISGVLAMSGMLGVSSLGTVSWFLLIPAISSFMAMNFTGSSTYTSLSGVKKEMRIALPVQIASAALAVILMVSSNVF